MDGQRGAGEHAKRCVRKRQDSPRMKVAFIPLRDEFADVVSSQYALLGHRLPASLLEGAMVIPMICIGNAARVRPRNNREMNLHHCQTPTSAEGNVAKNFERYACSVNCASILKQNMRGSLRCEAHSDWAPLAAPGNIVDDRQSQGRALRAATSFAPKQARHPVFLNGVAEDQINTDLTAETYDLTRARLLIYNKSVAFRGDIKRGSFDIPGDQAREWLRLPANPNG